MTKSELLEVICDAWADAPYPGDERLAGRVSHCPSEYSYVAEYFPGRDWRNVTLDGLRRDYPGPEDACLSFMSPEAFRYYLPAYMRMLLENPADAPESAVFALLEPREDAELRELAEKANGEAELTGASTLFDADQVGVRRAWWEQRVGGFTVAQRQAIVAFLEYLVAVDPEEASLPYGAGEALGYWSRQEERIAE